MKQRKTITIDLEEYKQLLAAKKRFEEDAGRHFDWGGFLVALALGYFIGRGMRETEKEKGRGS